MHRELPTVSWEVQDATEPGKGKTGDRFTLPKGPRPDWLKVRAPMGANYRRLKRLMRGMTLHTICEEANCPNIFECWERGTATFLILGDICTRACGFCAVTTGRPTELDLAEPERLADTVAELELRHVVITSVTRDDQADGGAQIFAACIREIRRRRPACSIEVLIPDFQGNWDALARVMDARPDILNHNVETVPRLYGRVRPKAVYSQSLELLARAKAMVPDGLTKSGLMVGLGETRDELQQVMEDLRAANCDILTVGQYLRPSARHLPIVRYYRPEEFTEIREAGEALGFAHVESGPLVRSSYHAEEQVDKLAGTEVPRLR